LNVFTWWINHGPGNWERQVWGYLLSNMWCCCTKVKFQWTAARNKEPSLPFAYLFLPPAARGAVFSKRAPLVDPVLLRKRIGMVFHKPNPFPKSVFDNIAFGPRLNSRKSKSELFAIVEKNLNRNILEIYNKVLPMLQNSLDSIVNPDADTANKILIADNEVDRLHRGFAQEMVEEIKKNPEGIETLIHYLHIARHLERIADHTTNIAEDIIYLTKGEIVRHGKGI